MTRLPEPTQRLGKVAGAFVITSLILGASPYVAYIDGWWVG